MYGLLLQIFVLNLVSTSETDFVGVSIQENIPAEEFILNVENEGKIRDIPKYRRDDKRQYTLIVEDKRKKDYFKIEETTGILRTKSRIDREETCAMHVQCNVKLDVLVQQVSRTNKAVIILASIEIVINIIDANDFAPIFQPSEITVEFLESDPINSTKLINSGIDRDSPEFGIKSYSIQTSGPFRLRARQLAPSEWQTELIVNGILDREKKSEYAATVTATDDKYIGSLRIKIRILDANDHEPVFQKSHYQGRVLETAEKNQVILTVRATDKDVGKNKDIKYRTKFDNQLFGVRAKTGQVYVNGPLDYETESRYQLTILAEDGGQTPRTAECSITIDVLDVNDHQPEITVTNLGSNPSDLNIDEGSSADTFIAYIIATDKDSGKNGTVECQLIDSQSYFKLTPFKENQYTLYTTNRAYIDRELKDSYQLSIECTDLGREPLKKLEKIQIRVNDINDHDPKFDSSAYTKTIMETNEKNVKVFTIQAEDEDIGDNGAITYSLKQTGYTFAIHPTRGEITALTILDREKSPQYHLTIVAQDKGKPPRSSEATLTIKLQDINDNRPIFTASEYGLSAKENQTIGTNLSPSLLADDVDLHPNNIVVYSIVEEYGTSYKYFKIDRHTGQLKTAAVLDREAQEEHILVVQASNEDYDRLKSTCRVIITVTDINDNPPRIIYPTEKNNTVYLSNKTPNPYRIGRIIADDADKGENSRLSYSLNAESAYFRLDPETGVIWTRNRLDSIDYKLFSILVTVRDNGDQPRRVSTHINLVVNKSIPFTFASSNLVSNGNLTIVIIVASVSFVIAVLLIASIVYVRRQSSGSHLDSAKYNCRTETQKMLKAKVAVETNEILADKTEVCDNTANYDKIKPEADFILDVSSLQTNWKQIGEQQRHSERSHQSKKSTELENHLLHKLARPDLDTDSSFSDSGRGGSEEGEEIRHPHSTFLPKPPPPPHQKYNCIGTVLSDLPRNLSREDSSVRDDATSTTSGSYTVDPDELQQHIENVFFKEVAV
ncbi:DgyrCDS1729 [Dimorphilus gyrociliatus]|uniref:DgyrCDS1729 n=1 Tax=Dimorphilus gyrociliatus TaxID=2664684 RepID=A0A7I8V9N0_9ANNE|nr:DgyrCDS1729 [Dimorphilus gyrociliatus]